MRVDLPFSDRLPLPRGVVDRVPAARLAVGLAAPDPAGR